MINILEPRYSERGNPSMVVAIYPTDKGRQSALNSAIVEPDAVISDSNTLLGYSKTRATRPGITTYSVSPIGGAGQPIQFLLDHWRLNTTTNVKDQNTIAVCNNTLWADTGSGNFTAIASAATDNKIVTGDILVGLAVLGIEDVGLYQYAQSGSAVFLGAEPNVYLVKKHRGSIYAAGNKAAPDVLYKSDTEAVTFTGGTSETINFDLGAIDSTGITGIFEFYGRLYVGKYTSMYELQTDILGAPIRIFSKTLGLACHNGVQEVGSDVIYPSVRGLHSLRATQEYGDVEEKYLSVPVADLWQNSIDFGKAQRISSSYIPEYNSYLMLYPVKGSTQYNLLGYNIGSNDFFLWENYPGRFITRTIANDTRLIKLMVGDNNGTVGLQDPIIDTQYLDFGQSYSSTFTTPPIFPSGVPYNEYQFNEITIALIPKSGNITIDYTVDNDTTRTVTIDQSEFTDNGKLSYKSFPLYGIGKSISLTFTVTPDESNVGDAMEIVGFFIGCTSTGETYNAIQLQV